MARPAQYLGSSQRDTEIWKFGNVSEAILASTIKWRASIKPYLKQEMAKLNATGRPINRPLWWDFPTDSLVWSIDDEYMFGDELLAAPVFEAGARQRKVYLPAAGSNWQHVFTGDMYAGGLSHIVPAPLDSFPLFRRGAGMKQFD